MSKSFISVKPEVDAVADALSGTAAGLATIQKRTLGTIAAGARKKINAAIRLTTKKRSGELRKAYRYKIRKDASQVNIFPRKASKKSQIFPKVYTLNYGLEGTKFLARGFIEKGEAYAEGGEWEASVNKYVQNELDKYWG